MHKVFINNVKDLFYSRTEEFLQPSTSRLSLERKVENKNSSSVATSSLPLPNLDNYLSFEDVLNDELGSGLNPKDISDKSRKIVESYKSAIFLCFGGKLNQVS